jgi:hypothetical protein
MRVELKRTQILEDLAREIETTPVLVLTAPRGGGKSHLLSRLYRNIRARGIPSALVQLEPVSASPEILDAELERLAGPLLGPSNGTSLPSFESVQRRLAERPAGSLLFLDDVTEIRTFSYFPGVVEPLRHFLSAIERGGRAVLTTRFSHWIAKYFPDLPLRSIPRVSSAELAEAAVREPELVARASGGILVHALSLAETLEAGAFSVEAALIRELSPGGRIEAECRATLSELLHRARGYGSCKMVLHVLRDEEDLKLTEIARRVERTAGTTRDYLRWLEEVDLIHVRDRRYRFVDPLVRLWMRVYGVGTPPTADDLRAEVVGYLDSLSTGGPQAIEEREEPAFTLPAPPVDDFID